MNIFSLAATHGISGRSGKNMVREKGG